MFGAAPDASDFKHWNLRVVANVGMLETLVEQCAVMITHELVLLLVLLPTTTTRLRRRSLLLLLRLLRYDYDFDDDYCDYDCCD